MNLEEIKEQHEDEGFITDDEGHDVISWLIAEVERQQLIISGKTQCEERQAAAMECAAIAECYSVETPKGNMPVGSLIASEIKKKFGYE